MVIKVKADSIDEAKQTILEYLKRATDGGRNISLSHRPNLILIVPEMLKQTYGVKTYRELEDKCKQDRRDKYEILKGNLRNELKISVAKRFLTKKEAPLHIADDDKNVNFKLYLEKFLKNKDDVEFPQDFNTALDTIVDIVDDHIKYSDTLFRYYVKRMGNLAQCISENSDTEHSLKCEHNTITIIEGEEEIEGQCWYYFKKV